MLGRFIKQEIKAQGKTMAIVYGALAVAMILLALFCGIQKIAANEFLSSAYYILCSVYMMTIIVAAVVSFIYLCYRFYQSMYSAQGYLTHTLPLKPADILHAKIFVSFGSLLLTVVFCVLSFILIGVLNDGLQPGEFMVMARQAFRETGGELGIPEAVFLLSVIFLIMAACLSSLLMFFAGSSIGQLSHRSKGAYGIAAGIGLYYFSEIVSVAVAAAVITFFYFNFKDMVKPVWILPGGILLLLFWAAVYYLICRNIVLKHLNLE